MIDSRFDFRSVSKTYDGQKALAEVSFSLYAGEHTAILGPSGCGKSTILRLLAGLDAPSTGQVLLDGIVISEPKRILKPPDRRGAAMVFQDLALWPNLSVQDNVLLGLSGRGISRQERRARAAEALTVCGLESLAGRKPGQISGGQQQRVALARAVAGQPAFLFLDEPFSGLDLITKTGLLREIAALAEARKMTLVLVTHDPIEVTTLCQRAMVIREGRVEEMGRLVDLLGDPQSEMLKVFQAYLQSQPGHERK